LFLFYDLFRLLSRYLTRGQIEDIARAYLYSADAHEAQFRTSGEPYIIHPIAVCEMLAKVHMDKDTIMAAILHDVVEDTPITIEQIETEFGVKVAELVEGVTKITQLSGRTKAETQAESLRKMILAMVADVRVIVIKLADRMHNMETIGAMAPKKQAKKARETLDIYAPLANRLGMYGYKNRFEDLCFKALYPLRYAVLDKCVRVARGHRRRVLEKIHQQLVVHLMNYGIDSDKVYGREKRLYSIFKKMRHRRQAFSEIMDVYAFRIMAPDVNTCYQLLGVVHNLYTPIPGRFKDYIAIPKSNGYQSLHTSMYGPHGIPLEIQIRTEEMDLMADQGIASHWLYKTSEEDCMTDVRTRAWLQRLQDLQQSVGTSSEFVEQVKVDLFPQEVFVFTPNGDIVQLPIGATIVDFAYSVHTQVGHTCVAAKINRRMVPLSQKLENSMTVEVLTSHTSMPNPMWLNFVKTAKARTAIRSYFNQKEKSEMMDLGRKLLQYSLSEHKLKWQNVSEASRKILYKNLGVEDESGLVMQIGSGDRASAVVSHQITEAIRESKLLGDEPKSDEVFEEKSMTIVGSEGMHVSYASCCYPIPGDDITGVLQKGAGIQVHESSCKHLNNMDYSSHPEDFITLAWSKDLKGGFSSKIGLEMENTLGALAKITAVIAAEKCNIRMLNVEETAPSYAIVSILLDVRSREHLADLIRHLRQLRYVMRVVRVKADN
jgi:GTP diphosphokinase / guanosine-3',5'-bis(diphosphate) 3'-diphosphatase